jgi:hypothetical protein
VDKSARGIVSGKALAPAAAIHWSDQAAAAGVVSWRSPVATTARRPAGQDCRNLSAVANIGFQPDVTGIAGQDHGHGLAKHRVNHVARRCGQEGEKEVLAGLALAGAGRADQLPAKANDTRSSIGSEPRCGRPRRRSAAVCRPGATGGHRPQSRAGHSDSTRGVGSRYVPGHDPG